MFNILPLPDPGPENRRPQNLCIGEFLLRGWLGGGRFSSVYLVEEASSGNNYALKIAEGSGDIEKHLNREAEVLAGLSHPSIVKFHRKLSINGRLALLLEPVEGVSLRNYMEEEQYGGREPSINTIGSIAREILIPLLYLHSAKLIHGDLKPENIAIKFDSEGNPVIKLLDLGLAGEFRRAPAGTPLYMAPEAYDGRLAPPSDLWSLGVIVYELIFKKTPYEKSHPMGSFRPEDLEKWLASLQRSGMLSSGLFTCSRYTIHKECYKCAFYGGCEGESFGNFFFCGKANPSADDSMMKLHFLLEMLRRRILIPATEARTPPPEVLDLLTKEFAPAARTRLNTLFCRRYRPLEWISRGRDHLFFRARDLSDGQVRTLMVFENENNAEDVRSRLGCLSSLHRPYFPRLMEQLRDEDRPVLVLENVEGSDLKSLIRDDLIDVDTAMKIALMLLEIAGVLADHQMPASLTPENVIVKVDEKGPEIRIAGFEGRKETVLFYRFPDDDSLSSQVWNIASILYEISAGIDPVSTLFPPRFFLTSGSHNDNERLVRNKFQSLVKKRESLPEEIFFTEEMVNCDRCIELYGNAGTSDLRGGRPCRGDRCSRGDFKVLRFRMPIPLAMLLKNRVFLFDRTKRLSSREFIAQLSGILEFDAEEMKKMVWIPSFTNFRLSTFQTHGEPISDDDVERLPDMKLEDIPPNFTWLPPTLPSLPLSLVRGYDLLQEMTGTDFKEDERLEDLYAWKDPGKMLPLSLQGTVDDLKTFLVQGHLTLARQLSAAGYITRALVEYERALDHQVTNKEILEEVIILCTSMNLPLRAGYYFQKLRSLGGTRNMGALYCYLETKKADRQASSTSCDSQIGDYFRDRGAGSA
jgi:serine/threonine protein kinase